MTTEEREQAHNFLIQLDQQTTFHKTIQAARDNSTTTLGNLVVLWDKEEKMLRIAGCVISKNLTRDEQCPITRNEMRKITQGCPIGFKLKMTTSQQLMASLPSIKTTQGRAFKRVEIDYAGAVMIRFNLGRKPTLTKAWIAVFVRWPDIPSRKRGHFRVFGMKNEDI